MPCGSCQNENKTTDKKTVQSFGSSGVSASWGQSGFVGLGGMTNLYDKEDDVISYSNKKETESKNNWLLPALGAGLLGWLLWKQF